MPRFAARKGWALLGKSGMRSVRAVLLFSSTSGNFKGPLMQLPMLMYVYWCTKFEQLYAMASAFLVTGSEKCEAEKIEQDYLSTGVAHFKRFTVLSSFFLMCLSLPAMAGVWIPGTPTHRFAGPVKVGAEVTETTTVTIMSSGRLGEVRVLTQGVSNQDYSLAPGGTCTVGQDYFQGQVCTLAIKFSPMYAGIRQGSIVLVAGDASQVGSELLVGSGLASVIRVVPAVVTSVAGNGQWIYRGDGIPATKSSLYLPMGGSADAVGNLFVADTNNQRIRRIDAATGIISTVAGNGTAGFSGDGALATAAMLNTPSDVIVDGAGNLYITDSGNQAIRMVNAVSGMITTVAGIGGQAGFSGDGSFATDAHLSYPNGIAFDGDHLLYISDTGNDSIRRVDLYTGIISTVAGSGVEGYAGDGGPGPAAMLNYPWEIALAPDGSLYIADLGNNRVRKLNTAGMISTAAGNGDLGFGGDNGPATASSLNVPASVAVDAQGNLYIADSGNSLIRKVSIATGIISTYSGTVSGYPDGNGGGTNTSLYDGPYSLFFDGPGNLYVSDMFHQTVREISSNRVAFTYAPLRVGRVSAPKLVIVENNGNASLNFSALQLVSNAAFDVATTTCALKPPMVPGATCNLGVEFAPTVTGYGLDGKVSLQSDSPNSPALILLNGDSLSVDPTLMTLTSSANPAAVGTGVTFTAVVTTSGSKAPTGAVTFLDGTTQLGTGTVGAGGVAIFATALLAPGPHPITGSYSGDATNAAALSPVLNEIVKQPTSTTLATSQNPATALMAITFTATVVGPSGTDGPLTVPSGTVTFYDGSAVIGASTLSSGGVASFTISTLTVGQHDITANYLGDSKNLASQTAVVTETVVRSPTTTTLGTSNATVPVGTNLTFSAVVTRTDGSFPNGIVNFHDGATSIGTSTVNSAGVATLTTSLLTVGDHSITAVYLGDANNLTSTSPGVVETVQSIPTTATLTTSANPVAAGAVLHLTATISTDAGSTTGGSFSGIVTFRDGTTVLGSANSSATGIATLDVATLSVGPHNLTAVYGGDLHYVASTAPTFVEVVESAATTTLVASSGTPSIAGKPVTFTATVTSVGGIPKGTVIFADGAISLGTGTLNAQGVTTITTSNLAVGQHTIIAAYGGDANDVVSASSGLQQTVVIATTSATISSSSNPAIAGLVITFSTVVAGNGGQAMGSVTFRDGSAILGAVTIDASGRASFVTTSLSAGSHAVTAVYAGDAKDLPVSSPVLTQVVQMAATTTALQGTPNPANQGTTVNVAATMRGTGILPTGTVQFLDGGVAVGSAVANGAGVASINLTALSVGQHSLAAVYSGDAANSSSTSVVLVVTILPTTTTVVNSDKNPAFAGEVQTLTAQVGGGTSAPTGTIVFRDGTVVLGTGTLNGTGIAALSISTLAIGQHGITASYSGDSKNGTSTSANYTEVVQQATTVTGLTSSAAQVTVGAPVTLTATITTTGGVAGGSVRFGDGKTTLGTAVVNSSGIATLTISTLSPAQHMLTALYTGDTNDLGSTSAPLTVTILQATPAVSVSSSTNPSLGGVAVTFTANFNSSVGTPSGTIVWKDGAAVLGTSSLGTAGGAAWTTGTLSIGQHTITATYTGDTNNAGAVSGAFMQTVQQGTSSTTLTSNINPALSGSTIVYTAAVTFTGSAATGTVTFSDGGTSLGTAVVTGGLAQFTISTLAIGNHSITAAYAGDANHIASQSAVSNQQILQAGSVTFSTSKNPSIAGTSLTLTATVAAPQGVSVTGDIAFKDGATVLGGATVSSSGVASLTLSTLSVGNHNLTAVYGGDQNNQANTSPLRVQVVQSATTSTSLFSSANPSVAGAPLTLTSTVAGTGSVVSGSVTFQDGTAALGVANVNGAGVATLVVSSLTPGLHSIAGVYAGDANNLGSASPSLSQSVKQTTTVALSSNQNPSLTPDAVTLIAAVSNGGAQGPTGTVVFVDGTTVLGTATVNASGIATVTVPAMAARQHSISAAYSGDAVSFASTSAALIQTVQLRPTTIILTASSTSLSGGQQVTLISILRWTGNNVPTGSVTFRSAGLVLGANPIDGTGVATLTVNLLNNNSLVVASYSGNDIYASSDSPQTSITVAKPTQFTLQINPGSMTMQTKQFSTGDLTITSLNKFSDTLVLGCLGLPFGATCTFTHNEVALGADTVQTVKLVVDTGSALTGGARASVRSLENRNPDNRHLEDKTLATMCFLPGSLILGLLFWKPKQRMRKEWRTWNGLLKVLIIAGMATGLSSCAGLQINGTPPGTYAFKISASGTGTGVTQVLNVALQVTQ